MRASPLHGSLASKSWKSNPSGKCAQELLTRVREIGNLLPNNQRQRRTCYALCHILYPVSAALASFFRMDSISTSFIWQTEAQAGSVSG